MWWKQSVGAVAVAALCWTAVAAPAAEVRTEQFSRLHSMIKPQPGESKWATIPWLTNLQEARERSVAEGKPLFVWRAGGGEVLGRA